MAASCRTPDSYYVSLRTVWGGIRRIRRRQPSQIARRRCSGKGNRSSGRRTGDSLICDRQYPINSLRPRHPSATFPVRGGIHHALDGSPVSTAGPSSLHRSLNDVRTYGGAVRQKINDLLPASTSSARAENGTINAVDAAAYRPYRVKEVEWERLSSKKVLAMSNNVSASFFYQTEKSNCHVAWTHYWSGGFRGTWGRGGGTGSKGESPKT